MISGEREIGPEAVFYKTLRLITPESANGLALMSAGRFVEAPVFISPEQVDREKCQECETFYGPLIYQVDTIVYPHHSHETSGGIYFSTLPERYPGSLAFSGWIGILEPINPIVDGRSQAVKIQKIKAFCIGGCGRELESGVLVDHRESLFPLCGLEKHPQYSLLDRFAFIITEDGLVLFSDL